MQVWLAEGAGRGWKNEHEGVGRIWALTYRLDRRPNDQGGAAEALTQSLQLVSVADVTLEPPGIPLPNQCV